MNRFAISFGALLLVGCDGISGLGGNDLSCSGDAAKVAITAAISDELENLVSEQVDQNPDSGTYDAAKLRTAISKVKFDFDKIRTTRDDPDSSRKFCNARILVKLPDTVKDSVRSARAIVQLSDINELARVNKMRRNGSSYESFFDFAVQPTDDGKDVVAEFEKEQPALSFLTEIFTSFALSDSVRTAQIAEQRAQAESEREERLAEQQLDQAMEDQASAELMEAKAENRLAVQRINAVWQAIPDQTRSELLDIQRAWIKKTTAACKVESAGSSEYVASREAVRLRCETRAQAERIRQLSQYAEYNDE